MCFVVVNIVVCLLFELGDCFPFLAGDFEGAECPNWWYLVLVVADDFVDLRMTSLRICYCD